MDNHMYITFCETDILVHVECDDIFEGDSARFVMLDESLVYLHQNEHQTFISEIISPLRVKIQWVIRVRMVSVLWGWRR